ncbi:MAG: flagellar basal-body rod protein FlgF [Candidatus Nitronauta litoralis]|uniref:Flagellar basal-body rod protein FlgF n=1 Tax=Candidatus Nitronauta litoralis TaxID=2705533 RepID=A0A7T0FZC4_9BACT|nr:MAG: flagellar basal-body rod protein FlgF [Candidatus Nitronauta litoralis]
MQESLYIAASGGMIQQRKMETLANNLANVSTSGFKKDSLVFKEILPGLNPNLDFESSKQALQEPRYSNRSVSYAGLTDFATHYSQGGLTATQNPLDLALEGDGFFKVGTEEGPRYTRKGNFHLDENNRIVSASGLPLLSPKDQEIVVPSNGGTITIDPQGTVTVGDAVQAITVGKLDVVHFGDKSQLKKDGESLFRQVAGDPPEKAPASTTIRQGFVESSNVNLVQEMTTMIQTIRTFEAMQKLIQTIDDLNGQSINSIARVA